MKSALVRDFFTSESVTEGHPDKMCDQISDAVLDAILSQDPYARVACETVTTTGLVMVMGEISTECYVDIPRIARNTIRDIGYNSAEYGFDWNTCAVTTCIDEQSPDIAMGVNQAMEIRARETGIDDLDTIGAGDQGMMFGFACDETPVLMPMPIHFAHRLAHRLSEVRKSGEIAGLRPDGKTQVTVEYDDGKPVRVDTVVVSSQHDPDMDMAALRREIIEKVIRPVIPETYLKDTRILVNPTGRFVIGGPQGDTGLTGRKIIVDTYGGYARHGGGAFSGKDPTKVDRSASYAARYAARNLVAAGLAARCEIQLAYAIGVAHPVSIRVDAFGTSPLSEEQLIDLTTAHFDFRPAGIIRMLDLRKPLYRKTAAYGHFGRDDIELPWEKDDMADALRAAARTLLD